MGAGAIVVTPLDLTALAGGLILVSALGSALLSWAFCTRPAPRWLRAARDVPLALAGARLLAIEAWPVGALGWAGALVWLALAAMGVAILAWNHYAAFRLGDRC